LLKPVDIFLKKKKGGCDRIFFGKQICLKKFLNCLQRLRKLGPLDEFLGVFGYLIENQYRFEHLKFASI
jgi:hypothetical protein